jgi:serine/threonine protein kinase
MIGIPFTPVFADFTSSFLTTDDPKTISSIGGGTYDYMAPEQLSAPFPLPNFRMDVYALAVSLLQVITGSSPFKEAGTNRHMKMAMVKEGNPLAWAARDATSEARLNSVAQEMLSKNGADLKAFLELGLRKNPEDRLSADEWSRLW